MVHFDDVAVAMVLRVMPVRRRPLPAFVLMPVMLIVNMKMGVLDRGTPMLEHLQVVTWP